MLSQGTPLLKCIHREDGIQFWLVDIGDGIATFHAHIEPPIPMSKMKHLEKIWLETVYDLWEKGVDSIPTYIEFGDETQKRFAEYFGFEETGYMKNFYLNNGSTILMEEMIYNVPLKD